MWRGRYGCAHCARQSYHEVDSTSSPWLTRLSDDHRKAVQEPTRNHSNQILCFLLFEPDRSSLASYLMPLRLCEHRYARADFHAKAQRKVARRKEEKLL